MKRVIFFVALSTHSLLQASEFATIFMSTSLSVLLITLVITLTSYIKKLQRESVKNSALFQHSPTPTLFINAKGKVVDLNQAAISLLGYSKKQLSRQEWYEKLLPDEHALQIRHQIHQHLKADATYSFTSHLVNADGKLHEVEYTIRQLPQPLNGSLLTLSEVPQKAIDTK